MTASGPRLRALGIKRRCGVERLRGLAAALLLAVCLAVMAVSACGGWPWVFTGAALLGCVTDFYLHRSEPALMKRLGGWRAGVTSRSIVRLTMVGPVVVGLPYLGADVARWQAMAVLEVACMMACFSWITSYNARARRLPVVTRNIQLPGIKGGSRAPRWLSSRPGQRLLCHESVVWLGLAASLWLHDARWIYLGLLVSGLGLLVTVVALVPWALHARIRLSTEEMLAKTNAWLLGYRPSVVLYFSGSRDSLYQVDMWLGPVERLEQRAMVLVRERHLIDRLSPTSLPVLCVPDAVHLMNLDLSSVRVALYAANVGKNIHMLREPHVKHVFVGHGDSDKVASVNPYAKAYDQVWTAGRAGRDRWHTADVGVRDQAIVEVGRPQLDRLMVDTYRPRHACVPTVMYAPTWEGWTDDTQGTSLIAAGENIVEELLALREPVRILYRPHPLTGIRSAAARRVHRTIVRRLKQADARHEHQPEHGGVPPVGHRPRRAHAQWKRAEERYRLLLDRYRMPGADSVERMMAYPRPAVQLLDELAEAAALRTTGFWRAHPDHEHLVVEGNSLSLYDCFDAADLLISDISSVVSDWVATLKPYALTDLEGLGADQFRRHHTAAQGAYVLTPDARGVRGLVEAVRFPGTDIRAEQRLRVRDYLLGPAYPPSSQRFARAVTDLSLQGGSRLVRLGGGRDGAPPTASVLGRDEATG